MIDEDKLNALELFGENEYLHKEIERLNNIINNDDVYGYIKHLEDLTTKKDNIIKEAKEYVIQEMNTINSITYINILEILDKENI